ncbi:hypothetical protein [Rubrivirga sp.]|uniref:hypothetical protein n=1 Tax=Rubrivirga sp. TaxID=1885344 RepID=UPI003C7212FE
MSVLGGGGFAIGFMLAAFDGSTEPYFMTDTISYVPAEAWWAHGLMMGTSFALMGGAFLFSLWLIGDLVRRKLLFLLAGLLMGSMGALMIWLAVTGPGNIEDGLRIAFGFVLGPIFVFFGIWALYRGFQARRDRGIS